jgi:trehalose 6-phosphate phosphatase
LLAGLVRQHKLLLFLDYDGTISEIAPAFDEARPVDGAQEILGALASQRERISIVIVTGRTIEQVRGLLGVEDDLFFAGVHGLELADRDGYRHAFPDLGRWTPDLDRTREWLKNNLAGRAGFAIEDKSVAIALHYRNADPSEAQAVRGRFEAFLEHETPELKARRGKMVVEAIPRGAGKDLAVKHFLERVSGPFTPVYFGDDTTDEDAFYALRDGGITIVVDSERRPSWAKYRIEGPSEVIQARADVAAAVEA